MTDSDQISAFISKWGPGGTASGLNEEQGAQQHFVELCSLLDVAPPSGGDDYLFEKGMLALGQRRGYADVFKRGHFAWENKAPGKPLDAALKQLMTYALALDNPPLLVVSDRLRIEIHTHFNGTPSERHVVRIEELTDPRTRRSANSCAAASRPQKAFAPLEQTGKSRKKPLMRSQRPQNDFGPTDTNRRELATS